MTETEPFKQSHYCYYLHRDHTECRLPAVVTFDYAEGIGSCETHAMHVMRFCMHGDMKKGYDTGNRPVTAVPTNMWEDYLHHNKWKAMG